MDTEYFHPEPGAAPVRRGALAVSALVPYKRLDLAIDTCRAAGVPLTIVGRGPEESRLRARAEGTDVEFLGWRSDEEVRALYRTAAVLLLPGIEDFGIVPVEAQACGTPVVALAHGGAAETVVDGVTGALVAEATAAAFADGIHRVLASRLDPGEIRANAERFSIARFTSSFQAAVADAQADPAR